MLMESHRTKTGGSQGGERKGRGKENSNGSKGDGQWNYFERMMEEYFKSKIPSLTYKTILK